MSRLAAFFFCSILLLSAVVCNAQSGSDVYVQEMFFARNVENRVPVDIGEFFPSDIGRVYCYTKIVGQTTPAVFTHVWYYKDVPLSQIELEVKAVLWRTWSYKTIVRDWVGPWRVDVVAPSGEVIASKSFTITK